MIRNQELKKQSEKILTLIDTAETSFEAEDEMRSHLAKYICILCSGFLENAIHILYTNYVKSITTDASIISYVTTSLNKVQNPNSNKFTEIAKSFKAEWEPILKEFLAKEERSAAVNYIMRDRHKIAHGQDSDITLIRIREYHNKTVEIVSYLENQCDLVSGSNS